MLNIFHKPKKVAPKHPEKLPLLEIFRAFWSVKMHIVKKHPDCEVWVWVKVTKNKKFACNVCIWHIFLYIL